MPGDTGLRAARRLEIVEVLDHLLRNVARERRIGKMVARARLAPELYVVLHDEVGSHYVCPEISDQVWQGAVGVHDMKYQRERPRYLDEMLVQHLLGVLTPVGLGAGA